MANNPHSSVCYVEPNLVFDRDITNTSEFDYGKIINPEDYCIYLSLTVEMSKREHELQSNFLTLTYKSDSTKGSSRINFMGGSMVEGTFNGKNGAVPYLTTRYADMYVTDLEDYGTPEMLGIKSVNIEYESATIPIITIKFTDVRGMSLFTPTELSRTNTTITSKNVEESFFQCFFNFPYPKFYVTVKGFYGKPVTYEVTCDKFNTNFNADSGNFDVDVRFIGYKYSFLTDVSLEAVMAAPFTDYLGKKYWEEQKNNGHFVITDIYGKEVPMPTLHDLNTKIKDVLSKKDPVASDTTLSHEEDKHEEEIRELQLIKSKYDDWYRVLEQDLVRKYGKDYCYPFTDEITSSGSIYTRIVILLNINKDSNSLEDDAVQFSEELKSKTNDLNSTIGKYNEKYKTFNKLNNISTDFSQYVRCKLFNLAYIDKYEKKVKFGGFHVDNKIPPTEVKKHMFTDKNGSTNQYDKMVKIIYNDGVDQYIDCYDINVDYTNVQKRIEYLNADANTKYPIKETKKRNHERNIKLKEELGWNPTIENFTKIVMAHLETFMYMMHTTCDEIKNNPETRKPSALNVTVGTDGNASDVPETNTFIPPFPRVTKTVVNNDGSNKQEDAWVGEFKSDGWREMDLVETFFNAIEEIKRQNDLANKLREEGQQEEEKSESCNVKYPITSFDFFLDSNVYGDDILSSFDRFVGGLAIRMFDILSISNFANANWKNYALQLGEVEANNFYKSVDLSKNKDIIKWMAADSGQFTAEKVLEIIKSKKGGYPWSVDNKDKTVRSLIGDDKADNWLSRYLVNKDTTSYMYPVQNISFDTIKDEYNMFKSGENFGNTNVILSNPPKDDNNNNKVDSIPSYNAHYDIIIENDYFKVSKILEDITANACSAYTSTTLNNNTDSFSKRLVDASSFEGALNYYKTLFKTGGYTSLYSRKPISIEEEKNEPFCYSFKGKKYEYKLEESDLTNYFTNEIKAKTINSIFLGEIFGKKNSNNKVTLKDDEHPEGVEYTIKEIDHTKSILNDSGFTSIDFLMGIDCINYTNLLKVLNTNNTFRYIPKLAILQIGAVLSVLYPSNASFFNVISNSHNNKALILLKTMDALPNGFEEIIDKFLTRLSPYSVMALVKYFNDWHSHFDKDLKNKLLKAKIFATRGDRRLLNSGEDIVKTLTNELILPVMLIHGNVNFYCETKQIGNGDGSYSQIKKPLPRSKFNVNDGVYKNFLNGFKYGLNSLLGLNDYEKDDKGKTVVRRAKESSHTTDEMRMEFYRYLKQLYDRWIPSTTMSDWDFKKFFEEDNGFGYHFYFIDSYYNKVGDKLIINPSQLSKRLDVFEDTTDVNASLYSLLGWVYGDNRCMLKCVQNFFNLGKEEDMRCMFSAMTYSTAMSYVKEGQDFVVVYTYEPSKYLNNPSSEFKDDSFMLNEEFYSPIAIRSRGAENEKKTFYKIPAFGVTYGKQYQSYFKNISFNMGQNVQTEQAIRAKHAILQGRTSKDKNGSVAQDLFDIYTTQSYTCQVEMMGCAWVQPMMYFVVLNVPMFRGSYMIMKVSHNITPGDMKTTFTGCRMSNVSNRLIEDVFLDPYGDESTPTSNNTTREEYIADVDNDCAYKVYPIFDTNSSGVKVDDDRMTKAVKAMGYLVGRGYSENAAAGICGNIMKESGFDEFAVNSHSYAAGLCQWLPAYHAFKDMYDNLYKDYGFWPGGNETGLSKKSDTKDLIKNRNFDYQLKFAVDSVKLNEHEKFKKLESTLMKPKISIDDAASAWCWEYEKPGKAEAGLNTRINYANEIYNKYKNQPSTTNKNEGNEDSKMNEDIYELFFNALQNTVSSTREMGMTLERSYYSKKGADDYLMMISTSKENKPKLSKVFDCILNTDEYFKYVNKLYWVYGKSNPQGAPEHVDVQLSPKAVEPNKQQVFVVETQKVNETKNGQIDGSFNQELLKSLAKKREKMKNDNVFCSLVPQMKKEFFANYSTNDKLPTLTKHSPTCCGNVGDTSKKMGETTKINEGGMIGNWNAKKAAEWLICASSDKSKHICAFAVQQAVVAGGIQCATGNGYRTALNLEKSGNWKFMVTGETSTAEIKGYEPQVGDIIGMTKAGDEKTYGHICMYCGKQYGWISDFKQYNRPYPYSKKGKGKYWIVQYKGGGKATTAKPQRCFNGKCLNQCSA